MGMNFSGQPGSGQQMLGGILGGKGEQEKSGGPTELLKQLWEQAQMQQQALLAQMGKGRQ